MKKVVEVSIGKMKFTLEEDAYMRLKDYLQRFERTMTNPVEAREVMEDVETRVAEILSKEQAFAGQVISIPHINIVISHLGEVEDLNEARSSDRTAPKEEKTDEDPLHNFTGDEYDKDGFLLGERRLMRDPDNKTFGGVCGGLSHYLKFDVTMIRVIFVILALAYGATLWLYIILWIVMPKAVTVAQKLQMRGFATTAENIKRYASMHK